MKPLLVTKLVLSLLLTSLIFPLYSAFGQSKPDLAEIISLRADERSNAYLAMDFQTAGWKAGQVIARYPYSVLTSDESMNGASIYELQIWRGIAARVDDDLLTQWDLIKLDAAGKVTQVIEDYLRAIPHYFIAASQNIFQTVDYIQRYPWANLPTDVEARTANIPLIPADGSYDVYGIQPKDGSAAISSLAGKVKQKLDIPSFIPVKVQAKTEPISVPEGMIPKDIAGHWAINYLLDLKGRAIIVGYQDQSIRPNAVLTKAEFTVMLVRSLGLQLINKSVNIGDLKGHWAENEVKAAYESGLVDNKTGKFQPNTAISRLETIQMLSKALQSKQSAYKQPVPEAIALKDLQSLSSEDKAAIAQLAANGIISGDPDGKFRPEATLTRAEACKMLSLFLKLK